MSSPVRTKRVAMLLPLLLAACQSVPTEVPLNPNRCQVTGGVQASVSPGLTPRISWSPSCEIGSISIVRQWRDASGSLMGELVWGVETSDESDPLKPPVRYGDLPHGFHAIGSTKPLITGESYELTLSVHYRRATGPVVDVGFATVTRLPFTP
jgi:hypothetical protein